MKVVLAGVSTRAFAESAARAGFAVTAIDAFADADQHPAVRALAIGGRFSAAAAAKRAQRIECDAVAYGANFENDPAAVTCLAEGRALWGNSADVIRRVRDPALLSRAIGRRGFAAPEVQDASPVPRPATRRVHRWLIKRRSSGGGHGVRPWRTDREIPRGCYLQQFIDGTPCSIVFVAAGGRSIPLGFSRQLVGDIAFGSSGFRYCGNILTAAGEDDTVIERARQLADVVCEEFRLVGVNGLDLIARDDVPYAIEVNPRWSASMELVERAFGVSVFGVHAAACRDGALPDFDLARARERSGAAGKAIVFARRDVTVGETRVWLADPNVRDVPRAGTRIGTGRPVCTVFASGRNSADCYSALVRHAALVSARL